MQRLGYITYSSSNDTKYREAFWTRARSGPWKLRKIGPSIAVCGNTVCTFPSCSGFCRHRCFDTHKMDYSSEFFPFSFRYHSLHNASDATHVRVRPSNRWLFHVGGKVKMTVVISTWVSLRKQITCLRWWLVVCKFVSINSYSSSNSTECRGQIGIWIQFGSLITLKES